MKLISLSKEALEKAFYTDLQEAFPASELKPLSSMERMRARGVYDALALVEETDETAPLGYGLVWKHPTEPYVLLDYLCVPAKQRNGGIGAKLLTAIGEYYPPETVILGESEAPTGNEEADEMICRRLAYYRRMGAVSLSYDTALFGVHFKTICWSKSPLPPEETLLQKHYEIYAAQMTEEQMKRFIQIPLQPGEKPHPVQDWIDEEGRPC